MNEYRDLEEWSEISLRSPRNIIAVANSIAVSLKRETDDHLEKKSLYFNNL